MEPTAMLDKATITLAGFSFYGNPFAAKDPWSEANEIGRLWQRLLDFLQTRAPALHPVLEQTGIFYEVHLSHPATDVTGEFEVFVGAPVKRTTGLPVELLVKILPPTRYAVFTLQGEAIAGDWHRAIYQAWMPVAGYAPAYPFSVQVYDERFKGVDNLAESTLDVYVPVR